PYAERRDAASMDREAGKLQASLERRGRALLFPLALFPRAQWHIVRDRNRWAWLRGGRAFGQPGPAPVAAALPRGAARQHRSWPEAFAMKARSLIQAHQLLVSGTPLAEAAKVALLIHGRHASAEVILPLADRLATPGVCFLAPSAETGSWYPGLFMGPIADNEPFLSRSLDRLGAILHSVNELGFDVATEIVL